MRLNPFRRRKALSASPGVLEALRDRRFNPYPALGGTNVRINAAFQRGIDGSYGWIYATQPAVRSVIDFIARNTAQLSLKLYERKSDTERERREDHAASETMRNPDGFTPSDAFIYRLVTDFLIWDNAYFLKFRTPGTRKLICARMMPNTVQVEGGRLKPEAYWFVREDGSWYGPVPPQDVFHWYGYNPEDPLLGLSKLETLRQELATDRAVQATLVELAKSGLKTGYIKRPLEAPSWSQEDAERFAEQWRAQKIKQDGRDPILDEGMTYETVGVSPKDAEILASRRFTKGEVASLYGVPLEAMGAGSGGGAGTGVEDERKLVYADVLPPITNALACQLDLDVLRAEYGEEDFYFEFDLNEKLRGDPVARFQAITAAVGAPWLLRDEARAMENRPPIDGGDEIITPLNVLVGDNPKPAPNVMAPQDPNKPLQDGSYRENGKALAPMDWNRYVEERVAVTKALEVTTQPRRDADMNRQKRNIALTQGELGRYYRHQEQSLTAKSSKAADTKRWNERLTAVLLTLLKGIMDREGGMYVGRLGGDDFDMRQIEHYIQAMAEQTAEGLNRTTQKDIAEVGMAAAFERARGLRTEVAGTTIGTRATVFARRSAAEQSPNPELRRMEWVRNTERHADLDGKSVPLGSDWGGIEPGSEPHCACTAVIS